MSLRSIPRSLLRLQLHTNLHVSFPVSIRYDTSPITLEDGVVYAAVVLVGLYAMVIFEVSASNTTSQFKYYTPKFYFSPFFRLCTVHWQL